MQVNDCSMLVFCALLVGDTVHQPTSIAFTLVPERRSQAGKAAMALPAWLTADG